MMERYIDPKKITLNCSTLIDGDGDILVPLSEVRKAIAQTPTEEDVLKIVRCKDCQYWNTRDSKGIQGICLCGKKDYYYGSEFYPFADDFCSYAERKENEK